ELRRSLTLHHYEAARPEDEADAAPLKLRPAESVQRFIDEERAETLAALPYHGMYEEGSIAPGVMDSLTRNVPGRHENPARLLKEHAAIFGGDLRERLAAYKERRQERDRLYRIVHKIDVLKGGVFQFRAQKYKTANAAGLLEKVEKEIKAD